MQKQSSPRDIVSERRQRVSEMMERACAMDENDVCVRSREENEEESTSATSSNEILTGSNGINQQWNGEITRAG